MVVPVHRRRAMPMQLVSGFGALGLGPVQHDNIRVECQLPSILEGRCDVATDMMVD
jgi:hypothetical protein